MKELSDLMIPLCLCLGGLGHAKHIHVAFTAPEEHQGIVDTGGLSVTDQLQDDASAGGMSGIWDCRTNG